MRELVSSLKGREIRIHVVETPEDLPAFKAFVEANKELLGFDTETTGLNWWDAGNGYHCRLAQFGNGWESYILPVELGVVYSDAMAWALKTAYRLVMQNRGFDIHTVEACFGVDADMLLKKTWDTKILAHLVDPRAKKEGGIGLKLEELVPHYIDADVGAKVKSSMTEVCKELNKLQPRVPAGFSCRDPEDNKVRIALDGTITASADGEYIGRLEEPVTREALKLLGFKNVREVKEPKDRITKENVWKKVPLDNESFLLYAGMDPIFAFRLLKILMPLIPARSIRAGLVQWEHVLNFVTYQMERTGYLVDEQYTRDRIAELIEEEKKWTEVAKGYGVENVGSNDQLIEAFTNLGVKLTEKTAPTERHPEGQFKMDEDVLSSIEHPLAEAIMKAKGASKKRSNWFEKALNSRDAEGRVHASINSLLAKTARMSITGAIPAQTLPSGTGYVRHCFLAEEGHVSSSVDFSGQELRVTAALSRDARMLEAFEKGEDLHQITADSAGVSRKIGKMCNFLVAYGGGPKALASQAGIPYEEAKKVIDGFNKTYPGVSKFGKKMADEARRNGYIYTITGRRIPVDRGHEYAAINYAIQSAARDVTARALIELYKAGYGPWLRLPVHDEVIFSFPKDRAEGLAKGAAEIMFMTLKGVAITTDIEIGDRSWGSMLDATDSKH
ncbi:DNA polymerase [Streptomyces sp. NPDC002644]